MQVVDEALELGHQPSEQRLPGNAVARWQPPAQCREYLTERVEHIRQGELIPSALEEVRYVMHAQSVSIEPEAIVDRLKIAVQSPAIRKIRREISQWVTNSVLGIGKVGGEGTQSAYDLIHAEEERQNQRDQRRPELVRASAAIHELRTRRPDSVGQNEISLVDADSFWVDAYFEETQLHSIHESDPAIIELMGYEPAVRGHVDSVSHGIYVRNAQQSQQGLATVNPIFTWVRLAQRVPVRVKSTQFQRE
jgi:hypothetical protein